MGRSVSGGFPDGGAPVPDAEHVAAIRYTILDDPDACAAFAQGPCEALTTIRHHLDQDRVASPLASCLASLRRLRADIEGLDLTALEPRKGLPGLFDSRGKRLKAFRAAFAMTASAATQISGDVQRHARTVTDHHDTLAGLWDGTRDAIIDLDAHIAAARAWLADQAAHPTASPETRPTTDPIEDQEETGADGVGRPDRAHGSPQEAPSAAAPLHPLSLRLGGLLSLRAAALAWLTELRTVQNAAQGVPAPLIQIGDAVEAWRSEWSDALGLSGRKPKKVRPDGLRLETARQSLVARITTAIGAGEAAAARRDELAARADRTTRGGEDGTASQA